MLSRTEVHRIQRYIKTIQDWWLSNDAEEGIQEIAEFALKELVARS